MNELTEAITAFYNKNETSSKILERFQASEQAWTLSMELIRSNENMYCLFGAQTLRQKILYDLGPLSPEAVLGIRNSIMELVQSNSAWKTLCICLADLAILTDWVDPISDMSAGSVKVLLEFLHLLPEEFHNPKIQPSSHVNLKDKARVLLNANAVKVVQLLMSWLAQSDLQEPVLECLNAWIRADVVPMEYIQSTGLLHVAASALQRPDLFDASIDLMCELVATMGRIKPLEVSWMQSLSTETVTLIAMLKANPEDEEIVRGLCRLFVEIGEASPDVVSKNLNVFGPLIEAILFCAGQDDLDIAKMTFNFWYILSDELTTPEMAQIKPVFYPVFLTLIHHILKQLEYPKDLKWTAAERDDFREFRHVIGDVLKDCVRVLGDEPALNVPYTLLKCHTQSSDPAMIQWQKIEAALFSLRSMCKELSTSESKYVPEIMAMLPLLPPHPKIKYATILVIGRFAEWTNVHPEMLPYQLDLISQGFTNDIDTVAASSQTFRDLCKYCSKHMVPYLEQLHPFYCNTISKVIREERVQMTEAIAYVISALPLADLPKAIQLYTMPIGQRLSERLAVTNSNDGHVKDILECVSELGTFMRYLNPEIPKGCSHPCVDMLTHFWGMLDQVLEQYGLIEQVSESVCRLLRNSMSSCSTHLSPLLPSLLIVLVKMFSRTKFPCYLWIAGHAVKCFGSEGQPELESVYKMVEQMTGLVFEAVQVPNQSLQDLEEGTSQLNLVISEFHYILSELVEHSPNLFLSSPLLEPSFFCGIHCLSSPDPMALSAVLKFFTQLFELSGKNLRPESLVPLVNLVGTQSLSFLGALFKGLVFSFGRDREVVANVADCLVALVGLEGPDLVLSNITSTLESLFSTDLPNDVKETFMVRFATGIRGGLEYKVSSALKELAASYHRRAIVNARH